MFSSSQLCCHCLVPCNRTVQLSTSSGIVLVQINCKGNNRSFITYIMITSFFKPKRKANASATAAVPENATDYQKTKNCGDRVAVVSASSSSSSVADCTQDASSNKRLKTDDSDAVQDLLQFLKDDKDDEDENSTTQHASWRKALDKHFSSTQFEKLACFVASQR